MVNLLHGDCLDVLKTLDDCSIDSIVTDPPYGLSDHKPADVMACLSAWLAGEPYLTKKRGFMGKTWDSWVPGPEVWRECFRVLKPGGHILAFAGSRTHDLMSIALRLAGFECRDTIMYVYGSGFPKSHDISKAIDKAAGAVRDVVRVKPRPVTSGTMAGSADTRPWIEKSREVGYHEVAGKDPITEAARQWQGWGTALKPAYEPVLLFRKPLAGTVAENVLKHGTGGLNIDGCRVPCTEDTARPQGKDIKGGNWSGDGGRSELITGGGTGRWPANFIHSGEDEVLALFPHTVSGGGNGVRAELPNNCMSGKNYARVTIDGQPPSSGSAARFFYCAKASKRDRDEGLDEFAAKARPTMGCGIGAQPNQQKENNRNTHNTVKPTNLMRYLCRLVTPPNGVILDPFMGSGSTGKAAVLEGFRFVGIEREVEYLEIAKARIAHVSP